MKQNVKDKIIGHHVSHVGHPLYVQFTLNAINTRHFICTFNIYTYPDERNWETLSDGGTEKFIQRVLNKYCYFLSFNTYMSEYVKMRTSQIQYIIE